ncbi:receptor-interacting serine/threonine-protein kinase 3 isoform X2 [Esox lucius]|uniref:receptor-interacting serine/threonine-protein kinase 3 isoform X2 n=1 Tax=Esox lucius TaxID=8010 RepID=UPI0014769530|nr:receptor-interacting serine/threonine-protein kinase 3 isoform X2 [Esox lucius]
MELSCFPVPVLIGDDSLQTWCVIGSGGFGQIHKARHVEWGLDVAIKLLHCNDGSSSSLLREAHLMRQGGSPYVLRILGIYQGHPPVAGLSSQLGLVMEFMERGSLATLQEHLSSPPPWPLSFRLAHEVALGMNFLHHLNPSLLHLDLKPNNVLLDDSLHAKLTDFGLARVYHSLSKANRKDMGEEVGTLSYMPPESFDIKYKPTRSSDVYSYGILLWSIITGEEPYRYVLPSIVRFRIPQGDRPPLESVNTDQAEGLVDLVGLMERCWHQKPTERPSFLDCLAVTERVYENHKQGINDAVYQVKKILDSGSITSAVSNLRLSPGSQPPVCPVVPQYVHTGPPPTQETAGGLTAKQKPKEHSLPYPTTVSSADQKPSTNPKSKISPPLPQQIASLSASSQSPAGPLQRQHSTPVPASHSTGGTGIFMSNVTGLQIGNNNHMYIGTVPHRKRHRNPTAPSSVNLPGAQPRSTKGPEPS